MGDVSKLNGHNIKDAYSREKLVELGAKIIDAMEDIGILKNYKDSSGLDVGDLKQLTSALQKSLGESKNDIASLEEAVQNALDSATNAENIAKGRNQSIAVNDTGELWELLIHASQDKYQVGQNIYIAQLDVPDMWIYETCDTYQYYEFLSGDDLCDDIASKKVLQIGYYKISPLETQKVDLTGYATTADTLSLVKEVNLKINKSDIVVVTGMVDFSTEFYSSGTYTIDIKSSQLPQSLQGGNKLDNYAIISSMITYTYGDNNEYVAMSSYSGKQTASTIENFQVSMGTTALGAEDEFIRIKLRDLVPDNTSIPYAYKYKIVLMKIS